MSILAWAQIIALFKVIAIDVTLAVDNAVVMAATAARLPSSIRGRAIWIGVGAAAFFRIIFACFAVQLLNILGLLLAGGLLLLWVAWKFWREIRSNSNQHGKIAQEHITTRVKIRGDSSKQAVFQIILADFSMSLDNTLAVAGAAHNHFWIMTIGLIFSVVLIGLAATFLAHLFHKYRWISYLGLSIVLYVALSMIWDGAQAVGHAYLTAGLTH